VAAAAARHAKLSRTILGEFAHLLRRTIEGQAVELGWSADNRWDISDQQYLAMVRDKTAWYSFIHPLRLGTLLGCGTVGDEAFVELGFMLGAIFQIRDDLDNLLADPQAYDKDLGCDLVEGKRTLPVLHVLHHGTAAEAASVTRQLGRNIQASAAERVASVLPILERCGSIDHAKLVVDLLSASAATELTTAFAKHESSNSQVALVETIGNLLFPAVPPQRKGASSREYG
jgi:geranylgeranyl diphosphate synthase, type II